MTLPGLLVPEGSSPAFSVHLFAFHPFFWREKILPSYFTRWYVPPFYISIRVDEPTFRDLGIALLSNDGDNLSAIGIARWSRSEHTGKWLVKFFATHELPPVPLAALGLPRATIEAKIVRIDDACDAGTRDVAASLWPTLRQALTEQDGSWSEAIHSVEHSLVAVATDQEDTALLTELIDQGAPVNTDRTQTAELPMGDERGIRTETVTRPLENALGYATRRGHCDAVDVLLARGARADSMALAYAVGYRHEDIMERLLQHGADPNGLIWARAKIPLCEYPDDPDDWEEVYLQVPAITFAHDPYREHFLSRLVAAGGDPVLPEAIEGLGRLSFAFT